MAHCPYHVYAVLLIERIVHINEEKLPDLLLGVFLSQDLHRVDNSLNTGLQPPLELLRPAGFFAL